MFEAQYTYKYIAQSRSSDTYGSNSYGSDEYSCADNDQICLTGGPGAPNTGFLATSNPVLIGGIFITAALVVTVIAYAIIRKVKSTKAAK